MSAPLWTSDEIAAATGGRATRGFTVAGVAIDGRRVAPGDLFVALPGTAADGHDYVAQALANGAAAALVTRHPDKVAADAPLIHVADSHRALEALGAAARARATQARVVGITGSVGKTGTRTALEHVLAAQAPTHASQASYNNHVGVPLSLARMPAGTRYGVFEMGMNHAGEIAGLTVQVRPHVAIITTVEAVHLEFFDSVAGIADAKSEIFEGLEPGGVAILNRDNPYFERCAAKARARGARIVAFGSHADADVRLKDMALKPECSCVSATVHGVPHAYKVGAPGRHWVMNSLAVLAAVEAVGADLSLAGLALADISAPDGRGSRIEVRLPGGPFTLVDESYNASPASMRVTFETIGRLAPAGRGRRVAVLGDMRELGPDAPRFHAELAPDLEAAGFDLVFAAGANMAHLFAALPPRLKGAHAPDSATLAPIVAGAVRAGDIVVVKGSLGSRMGPLVDHLKTLHRADLAGSAAE
jgi:UDP-N-acetylmuramoyl-tripeptide--D-alanyl-D-alanine ligase